MKEISNLEKVEAKFEQALERLVDLAAQEIKRLRRQMAAQHRYIQALEKQLEPEVVEEIRTELSAVEKARNANQRE